MKIADPIIIGHKIKLARHSISMTQADLADTANLSQSEVSRIERGGRDLTVATLAKICEVLKVDNPNELITP